MLPDARGLTNPERGAAGKHAWVERKGLTLAPQAKVSIVIIGSRAHSFIHLFIHQTLSNTAGPSARPLGLPVLMGTVSLVVFLLSSHTVVAVS